VVAVAVEAVMGKHYFHLVVVAAAERVVKMVACYLVAPAVVLLGVHLAQLPAQMNLKD
jgi:hypothetical protein